jgi:hypothetical protein
MQKAQELQQEKSQVVAENKQLMGMMPEVPDVAMQEPTFGGGLTEPKPISLMGRTDAPDPRSAQLLRDAGFGGMVKDLPLTTKSMPGLSVDMPGPISTAALRDFTRPEVVQINLESFRRAGVPSGPSTPEEADRVNDALNQIYAEIDAGVHPLSKGRTQQRPAQQTRFAPTGVPVSALQARASAAPTMAQAPAVAPQPTAMGGQDAQGASDAMLMKDPTNRAFVRSILRMQEMSGETKSLEAAMDLLRLELAKRGTPARDIVDVQAREVLTEDPQEAAKRMTLSNVYNLASQSTVADWPKIEPLAREVIKRQGGYGFFEGPNVDEELEKIRKMLAGQTKAVPGVEFDLSGAAKTARETAKSFKDRQTKKKYKGSLPSTKKLVDKYLKAVPQAITIGGLTSPRQIFVETQALVDLRNKIDSGKGTERDMAILSAVAQEQNKRNSRATSGVPGLSSSDAAKNRERQTQRDYDTAKNNLNASERRLKKAKSSLKAIDDAIEKAKTEHNALNEEQQLLKSKSHQRKIEELGKRKTRAEDRVAKEVTQRDEYQSEVNALEKQIQPGTVE